MVMTLMVVCHAVAGVAPGFQQVAQFTDVARGVAAFQAEMARNARPRSAARSSSSSKSSLAQQEHVLDEGRLLLFGFGHAGLQKVKPA